MSTNFYLVNIQHGAEHGEHIGKRSGGWAFTFQGCNFKTREAWETRLKNLGAQELVEDEYGRTVEPDDMLSIIEASLTPYGPHGFMPKLKGGPDPHRNWVDGGCSFSNYEFS